MKQVPWDLSPRESLSGSDGGWIIVCAGPENQLQQSLSGQGTVETMANREYARLAYWHNPDVHATRQDL